MTLGSALVYEEALQLVQQIFLRLQMSKEARSSKLLVRFYKPL